MAQKQKTAVVVVSKELDRYFGTAPNQSWCSESRSTGDTHLVYADLEDTSDHHGLWLKNIKTTRNL